ncbi:unnamed protein product [Dibothriocephalus latus]|uniref:Uncharacterized protein n=1 Tax=Dibothriocephalus latus TaxID=60516 RepID=A0A3P7MCT3_DIBLA|nr:unnamed protein product [Dibothriocephalus latus]
MRLNAPLKRSYAAAFVTDWVLAVVVENLHSVGCFPELLLREKCDETDNRLGHARILQLLKFCHKTHLTFNRTMYEQKKGTPMGSPMSGLIYSGKQRTL